jgi:hypothetical protein
MPKEKLRISLYHVDDGLWAFLKAFETQAFKDGWTDKEIQTCIDDAFIDGDALTILHTLLSHCVITKLQKKRYQYKRKQ